MNRGAAIELAKINGTKVRYGTSGWMRIKTADLGPERTLLEIHSVITNKWEPATIFLEWMDGDLWEVEPAPKKLLKAWLIEDVRGKSVRFFESDDPPPGWIRATWLDEPIAPKKPDGVK